jgi:two-component system nitrogen regulation response regulator NtrX
VARLDRATVLIVDDEAQYRDLITRILTDHGVDSRAVSSTAEACAELASRAIDLVLCDVMMPDETGPEFLARLRSDHPDLPVVMVSGIANTNIAQSVVDLGAYGYITKPFTAGQLIVTVANGLHYRELARDSRLAHQRLERVGERADGIAHDLNNLLGAIRNYAAFAATAVTDNAVAAADIEQIRIAVESAIRVTNELSALST